MRVSKIRVRDNQDFAHGLDVEARLFAHTADSDDSREGFAAFVEKRPPRFTHS
jgi:enoyl-CoA hydratase/carnithine racemase